MVGVETNVAATSGEGVAASGLDLQNQVRLQGLVAG
jgi:hypothetical protein